MGIKDSTLVAEHTIFNNSISLWVARCRFCMNCCNEFYIIFEISFNKNK